MKVKREDHAKYTDTDTQDDQSVLDAALAILDRKIEREEAISSPQESMTYIRAKLHGKQDERFAVLYMDNRNRPLFFGVLFNGTIDGASVHPRVLVRQALELNAATAIIAHNHPSGTAEPSEADKGLTKRIQDIFAMVDVRLLDHIIVGEGECVSFANRGLL